MRSRLRLADLLPLGLVGLRTRRLRTGLSTLGIAIGIASIVSVLGITASSQADLLAQIDRLGTNLLTVASGHSVGGDEVPLPATAPKMIGRVAGVQQVAATAELRDVHAYRNDLIPPARTGSIAVRACAADLLATLGGTVVRGTFFDSAGGRYPVAVLGRAAADRLGIALDGTGPDRIWLTGHWFSVIGVLASLPLAAEIDQSVLIGSEVANTLYGYHGGPSRIYVRARPDQVEAVSGALARAANPAQPNGVAASRPSDALTARLAVARSGTSLFLGLGAVALLVGAVGIANVMVIGVLERRTEIGIRRAIGARRSHIAVQFLTESLLLGALGGLVGVGLGATSTAIVAADRGWGTTLPAIAVWGGLAAAVATSAVAALYPAVRAARLAPTEALRAT